MSAEVKIGIIGGSGLYGLEGGRLVETVTAETPFGAPSGPISVVDFGGRVVAFLPRHGLNHQLSPSQVPYAANIWALKQLGVEWIVTASAVGSLKEEIVPGDFVVPDQIIDKTTKRGNALYPDFVTHVSLGEPYEPLLRKVVLESIDACGIEVHREGTYVCMEGPAFSTKAESRMHQLWGATIVGMTAMPEARFAREAEIAYATVALPTDYDVWFEGEEVDVTKVLQVLKKNHENVKKVLKEVIPRIPLDRFEETIASSALRHTIVTSKKAISEKSRHDFACVLDRYL